jgi:hypothetical protein
MSTNSWGSHGTGFQRPRWSVLLCLTAFMILTGWRTLAVWAQQITGSIAGTVKDVGGVLTSATVNAVQQALETSVSTRIIPNSFTPLQISAPPAWL